MVGPGRGEALPWTQSARSQPSCLGAEPLPTITKLLSRRPSIQVPTQIKVQVHPICKTAHAPMARLDDGAMALFSPFFSRAQSKVVWASATFVHEHSGRGGTVNPPLLQPSRPIHPKSLYWHPKCRLDSIIAVPLAENCLTKASRESPGQVEWIRLSLLIQ